MAPQGYSPHIFDGKQRLFILLMLTSAEIVILFEQHINVCVQISSCEISFAAEYVITKLIKI